MMYVALLAAVALKQRKTGRTKVRLRSDLADFVLDRCFPTTCQRTDTPLVSMGSSAEQREQHSNRRQKAVHVHTTFYFTPASYDNIDDDGRPR